MRLLDIFETQITEKTSINVAVLDIIATSLIASLRYPIAYGKHDTVQLDAGVEDILRDKFGEVYASLARYIRILVPVHFHNIENGPYQGTYSHGQTHTDSRYDSITVMTPQDPNNPKAAIQPQQIVASNRTKSTLMHELRHVMQRTTFGEFYQQNSTDMSNYAADGSDGKKAKYDVDTLEIDAAFTHLINDHREVEDPREFARIVVDDLGTYKKLSPKQKEHYFRKAATFANDRTQGDIDDRDIKTRMDDHRAKMDDRRAEKRAEIKAILFDAIGPLSALSRIGMSENFNTTFPGRAIVHGHLAMTYGDMEITDHGLFLMCASLIYKWIDDNNIDISINDFLGRERKLNDSHWDAALETTKEHPIFVNKDRDFVADVVNQFHTAYEESTNASA